MPRTFKRNPVSINRRAVSRLTKAVDALGHRVRRGAALSVVAACFLPIAPACTQRTPAELPSAHGSAQQQAIVNRATSLVQRWRGEPRFSVIDRLLAECRAVLIFPKLIKASLIVGGEGGNGLLLTRAEDGTWSSPAFYSLGAPSVGLQAGFRESSVMLFVMNDLTAEQLLHSSMTLGAQTSATLGHIGENGLTEGEVLNKDIYVVAEAGGAFAGVSFDGYVIATRRAHNELYYGAGAQPRAILIERSLKNADAAELQQALAAAAASQPSASVSPPAQTSAGETVAEPVASTVSTSEVAPAYRPCSPESRQAAACSESKEEVCATLTSATDCSEEPCSKEHTARTFNNACEACREPSVEGYRLGPCAQ